MTFALILLAYLLAAGLFTFNLWKHYLAVMSLQRARDAGQLTKLASTLGTPLLVRGYMLDFLVNVFVLSLVLLEFPRELTVTARLKRHNQTARPGSWSRKVVTFFQPLLDPFDPDGRHI